MNGKLILSHESVLVAIFKHPSSESNCSNFSKTFMENFYSSTVQ